MAGYESLGSGLVLFGAVFLALGALGLLRMPDVYNRMQAGTKATTLGNILTLAGLALHHPVWAPKILLIALFVLLTNPVSSHALARAVHRAGFPLAPGSVRDDLAAVPGNESALTGATATREGSVHQPGSSGGEEVPA